MNDEIKNIPIEKMDFSTRTFNALKRNKINTIGELSVLSYKELKSLRYLGTASINEIKQKLSELNSENIKIKSKKDAEESDINNNKTETKGSLKDIGITTRLYNCLIKNNITSINELLQCDENFLDCMKGAGAKTKNEARRLILNLKEKEKKELENSGKLNSQELSICGEIVNSLGCSLTDVNGLMCKAKEEYPNCGTESLVCQIYKNETINDALNEKLKDLIKSQNHGISRCQIDKRLPAHLFNTSIVDTDLKFLEISGQIKLEDEVYYFVYPSAIDIINNLKDSRNKIILQERMAGRVLEEIASHYGLTRERVRQICGGLLKRLPRVEEDKYQYITSTYNISQSDFCKVFSEPATTYFYLSMKDRTIKSEKKNFEDILSDENITTTIKKKAEPVIYKDYLNIDGVRIPKKRPELFHYIVKTYCREKQTYNYILDMYDRFLEENNLEDINSLIIDNHSYENKCQSADYILWNRNHSMRYYNIRERDYRELFDIIDFEQYKNTEMSTLKIFREYPELMSDYDIHDEYELHNLLKKIWKDYSDLEIDFVKMPTIKIGKTDRENQIMELLAKNAPISIDNFASLYEEEYGIKSATAKGTIFTCIDRYLSNGIYRIEQEDLTEEQYDKLHEILKDDFYTIKDIQRKYEIAFPDSKQKFINIYNIKKLGFLVNSSYVISNKYSGAAEYFRKILTSDDIVDISVWPNSMTAIGIFTSELYKLRTQREIIEFAPHKYINMRRLKSCGITEETLLDYINKVKNFVKKNSYFTISSIRQDGFKHELDDLGFDEWFYSSILIEDRENFSYQRMGKNRLLYLGKKDIQLTTFLEWILESEEKIELDDLTGLLKDKYGIYLERFKIIETLKDTNLYYDKIMDKVYIDYDTYFEEV